MSHLAEAEELVRSAFQAVGLRREELLREAMVSALPAARAMAHRYRGRGEPDADLEQVAAMAMVKAIRRYRPKPDTSLVAFATPTVHGELKRYFRDSTWLVRPPRRLQELRIAIRTLVPALTQELGHAPSAQELATVLGAAEAEVRETLLATAGYSPAALDGGGHPALDPADPVDEFEPVDRFDAVRPELDRLPERERRVMAMHFYGGMSQQEVADEMDMTQVQVSRMISGVARQVRATIEAAGDDDPIAS